MNNINAHPPKSFYAHFAERKDSEGLRDVCPSNNCLSLGQAFQSYPSPNTLVWSDIQEEDIGGLRSHVNKNAQRVRVNEKGWHPVLNFCVVFFNSEKIDTTSKLYTVYHHANSPHSLSQCPQTIWDVCSNRVADNGGVSRQSVHQLPGSSLVKEGNFLLHDGVEDRLSQSLDHSLT